jgi:hypothetical protein
MISRKICLSVATLCLLLDHAVAQESSRSVMIDSSEFVNCEWQTSYIDLLLSELQNKPALKGVIVIHGHDPVFPYRNKLTIRNHLMFRKFDESRIEIVLGKREAKTRLELWTMPENEIGKLKSEQWNYKINDWTQPTLVHFQSWVDGIGCGEYEPDLKFYSKFLLANDDLKGRLIIRTSSNARFRNVKARLTNEFNKLKVPRSSLEFGYIASSREDVEYWYFPKSYFD